MWTSWNCSEMSKLNNYHEILQKITFLSSVQTILKIFCHENRLEIKFSLNSISIIFWFRIRHQSKLKAFQSCILIFHQSNSLESVIEFNFMASQIRKQHNPFPLTVIKHLKKQSAIRKIPLKNKKNNFSPIKIILLIYIFCVSFWWKKAFYFYG